MLKKIIFVSICLIFLFPNLTSARENVYDWYIQNFYTKITVNQDSSLIIEEQITADCGNGNDKHGIFRVLPTQTKTPDGTIKTPIELIKITDFQGQPYNYQTIRGNNTLTWKIGNPDTSVKGVNTYLIVYKVKNTVQFNNSEFDEFYWNLLGNFWDLEIDNFTADIIFQSAINQDNTKIDYYAGNLGSKDKTTAGYSWLNKNTLRFESNSIFYKSQGLTTSVTFPKNILQPTRLSLWEKLNTYFFFWPFIIPVIIFILCFLVWIRFGKDPKHGKTIIALYEPPKGLTPAEIGSIHQEGTFNERLITATIINLAVNGYITLEQISEKKKFSITKTKNDFKITRLNKEPQALSSLEKLILDNLLDQQPEITLSAIQKTFPKKIKGISKQIQTALIEKGYFAKKGFTLKPIFIGIGVVIGFISFAHIENNWLWGLAGVLSALSILIFGLLMAQKTPKGAEVQWEIKGFKHYMDVAEKHRQEFYEKENIFEKFLPFAIAFGMTKQWINKMKQIYGEDFFANYAPAWYIGSTMGGFDADSLNSSLTSISNAVSQSMGTSSGSGGSGFSGGGGGGGGGGGW